MKTYVIRNGQAVPAALKDFGPIPGSTNFRFLVGRGVSLDGLNLRISMPAVLDEDFAFSVDDRGVLIFGTRREPAMFGEDRRFALRYGSFQQRVAIPRGVDPLTIKAAFHHGVLDIHAEFSAVPVPVGVPLEGRTSAIAQACAAAS